VAEVSWLLLATPPPIDRVRTSRSADAITTFFTFRMEPI
jgi:hypothetical protein